MRKKRTIVSGLIGSLLSMGLTTTVFASEEVFNMDEYVVTANRIAVKTSEVAANVTVIENEEIEKGAYSNVSDILRAHNINMGSTSAASYPIINGDDRVLVMVDGRKMNWSHLVVAGNSRAVNINNLAVKNIERIEIVRGPNSALYGSDAVGGVINIITKKATENSTRLATEFGSWNASRYTLTTEGVNGDTSYALTFDKQKRGNFDYNSPHAEADREFNSSEIDREYANLRIDRKLGDNNELSLEIEHMKENNGYGLSLANTSTGAVLYPNSRRNGSDFNVALTYSWHQERGTADYFRIYQNSSDAVAHYGSAYEHDLRATGAEWQQRWSLGTRHTLVGGAMLRKEQFDELSGTVRMHGEVTTNAVFMENRWKLDHDFTLTAGNRFDHSSDFGDDVTSHVSLNKELSNNTNAYVSWGEAVKNPTLKQRYANTPSWIGNPDLKAETGETVTLGVNHKLDAATSIQASIYNSRLKNAIAWLGGSPGKYINVNREKREGLEINATHKISDQWGVNAGYSYAKIEQQSNSADYANDVLNSRPNGYSLGVQYHQDKWDAGLTMLAATGRSLKAFTSDSYLALDLVLGYQADENTRMYVKGYNLTNEAYELVGATDRIGKYPMAGRNFSFGVEYRI